MKTFIKITFFALSALASSYGENARQMDFETQPNGIQKIITGRIDSRKMIPEKRYVDLSTVALARGAGLDSICSGTVVGLAHIITAAHCIYDEETLKIKKDITIVPGLHMGLNFKPTKRYFIDQVYLLSDYIKDITWNGATTYARSKDIAIITVRDWEEFDKDTIRIDIGDSSEIQMNGQKFNIRGYTGDKDGLLPNTQYYQDGFCYSKGQRYNYTAFMHDCDTSPGTSGMGLVFDRPKTSPNYKMGRNVVLGVHTGQAGSSSGMNSAAFIRKDVLDEIKNKVFLWKNNEIEKFQVFDYPKYTSTKTRYIGYQFRNNCSFSAEVEIYYKNLDGDHYVHGPYKLKPGQLAIFKKKTLSQHIKYHASLSNGTIENLNDVSYAIKGKSKSFENRSFANKFQDNEIVLCQ